MSEMFDRAWAAYPKRPGNNRMDAWKAWQARIAAGEIEDEMLHGTERYAAYVEQGRIEPKFVKHAKTFFGPCQHYRDEYDGMSRDVDPYLPSGDPNPDFLRGIGIKR